MKKVLIIGGSGYIGCRIVALLCANKFEVTVLAKETNEAISSSVKLIIGDRSSPRILKTLSELKVDIVIDLIGYNPVQIDEMVGVFSSKIERYIFLSTIAVYQGPFTFPLREDELTLLDNGTKSYGNLKAACERVLMNAKDSNNFPSVILRSAPIMGPDDPVSREGYFLKRFLIGRPIIHPWKSESYVLNVFIDDLIKVLHLSIVSNKAIGNAYHLSSGDSPVFSKYLESIRQFFNQELPKLLLVEAKTLHDFGFSTYAFPYAPGSPGRIDISMAKSDLNYTPTPFSDALDQTLKTISSSSIRVEKLNTWPGFNATQTRFCGLHNLLHEDLEERFINQKKAPSILGIDLFLKNLLKIDCHYDFRTSQEYLSNKYNGKTVLAESNTEDNSRVLFSAPLDQLIPQFVNNFKARGANNHEDLGLVVAVLEPVPNKPMSFECFLHQSEENRVDYTFDNFPPTVHVRGFRDLENEKPTSNERIIVLNNSKTESASFGDWINKKLENNELKDADINHWSRHYLVPESNDSDRKQEAKIYIWNKLFDLCRLLKMHGYIKCNSLSIIGLANHTFFTSVELKSIQENQPNRFKANILKVRVDNDYYLFAPAENKLAQVPTIFAFLIDHFATAHISPSLIKEIFDFELDKAREVYEIYNHEFTNQLRDFYA